MICHAVKFLIQNESLPVSMAVAGLTKRVIRFEGFFGSGGRESFLCKGFIAI
jgi:hypothetical protein